MKDLQQPGHLVHPTPTFWSISKRDNSQGVEEVYFSNTSVQVGDVSSRLDNPIVADDPQPGSDAGARAWAAVPAGLRGGGPGGGAAAAGGEGAAAGEGGLLPLRRHTHLLLHGGAPVPDSTQSTKDVCLPAPHIRT